MADGKIVQCIGAVVDVEFPRNAMPKVYDALKMEGSELTLEVQQQLGDGVVRTIALGSSEGLRRGMIIQNTGNPIMVPVGTPTLGRIMDVLGNPIDECGPVSHERMASIHREAPAYDELSPSTDLLETGIKVIDLVCPFAKGGKVGLFGSCSGGGGTGVGVGSAPVLTRQPVRASVATSRLLNPAHHMCRPTTLTLDARFRLGLCTSQAKLASPAALALSLGHRVAFRLDPGLDQHGSRALQGDAQGPLDLGHRLGRQPGPAAFAGHGGEIRVPEIDPVGGIAPAHLAQPDQAQALVVEADHHQPQAQAGHRLQLAQIHPQTPVADKGQDRTVRVDQARGHRRRRIGFAPYAFLGPAQVRGDHHRSAFLQRQLQGGQRSGDALLRSDAAGFDRHVEILADQHALADRLDGLDRASADAFGFPGAHGEGC